MKSTSVYFKLVLGIVLFFALHFGMGAGLLSMAAFMPFHYSPNDPGGNGDPDPDPDPNDDDKVTLTKKDLQERVTKSFRNGLNQGKTVASKDFKSLFETVGIPIVEDDFSKTLAGIQESLKKGGETNDQRVTELEGKLKVALQNEAAAKELVVKSQQETADYIVNNELLKVLGSKASNANAASLLIRNEAKIEKQKDGSIKIFDKTGNQVFDEKGDPITLSGYVDKFLSNPENDYLVKSGQRQGGQGGAENTGISKSLEEKVATDPTSLSAAEQKQYIDNWK